VASSEFKIFPERAVARASPAAVSRAAVSRRKAAFGDARRSGPLGRLWPRWRRIQPAGGGPGLPGRPQRPLQRWGRVQPRAPLRAASRPNGVVVATTSSGARRCGNDVVGTSL